MEYMKSSSLATCSKLFVEYFNSTLEQDIKDTAGRWVLEPLGIYNPYSGVTSNMAESMNAVVKRLTEWKEVPCNVVVEFLYHFQSYYANEVRRGICGMGQYQLKQQYAACRQQSDMFTPLTFVDPATYIQEIRSGGMKSAVTHAPANGPQQAVHSSQPPKVTFPPAPVAEPPENFASMSRRARGRFYVNNNCLVLNPELHAFTVKTPSGINAVTLFPKEKCTCPATGACSHILAARYAIGIEDAIKCKPTVNLTQLRRNTRKRPDKKSGRKQPRKLDVDVVPPPDANGDNEHERLDDSIALASKTKCHTIQQSDTHEAIMEKNAASAVSSQTSSAENRPTEHDVLDVSSPDAEGSTVDVIVSVTQSITDVTTEQPVNCSLTTEDNMRNCGTTSIAVKPMIENSTDNKAVKAWNADVDAVALSTSNIGSHTSTVGSFKLSNADFKLLHPPHWLDDKIMDAYMELLQMESGRRFCRMPSTIVLKWDRGQYKDWLFEKVNFKSFDYILLPVCFGADGRGKASGEHWMLLAASTSTRQVSVFNSSPNVARYVDGALKTCLQWMNFMAVRHAEKNEGMATWTTYEAESVEQRDGHSCGVLTLMNAEAIARRLPPLSAVSAEMVLVYRRYIATRLQSADSCARHAKCAMMPDCRQPASKNVQWVHCEGCMLWQHFACVNLRRAPRGNYFCPKCRAA